MCTFVCKCVFNSQYFEDFYHISPLQMNRCYNRNDCVYCGGNLTNKCYLWTRIIHETTKLLLLLEYVSHCNSIHISNSVINAQYFLSCEENSHCVLSFSLPFVHLLFFFFFYLLISIFFCVLFYIIFLERNKLFCFFVLIVFSFWLFFPPKNFSLLFFSLFTQMWNTHEIFLRENS